MTLTVVTRSHSIGSRTATTLLTLLTLLATACSSSSAVTNTQSESAQPETSNTEANSDTSATSPPTTVAVDVETELDENFSSPLDEFLGLPSTPREWLHQFGVAEADFQQEFQVCIQEQGFEYHPIIGHGEIDEFLFVQNEVAPENQLVEEGYRITSIVRESLPFLTSPDYNPEGVELSPRDAYYQSLLEDERSAYFRAEDKCRASAYEAAPAPGDHVPLQIMEEAREYMADVRNSPDTLAVWQDWSDCMNSQGYRASDRESLILPLQNTAGLIQAAVRSDLAVSPELAEQIDELETLEFATARADFVCSTENDTSNRLTEIVYNAETKYIEENGDRIALLLAEN